MARRNCISAVIHQKDGRTQALLSDVFEIQVMHICELTILSLTNLKDSQKMEM